ncbi:hypothetical protein HPB48_015947 [Haemaphysalis longicornis]|uniref:Uncharacterized protein n=1 Tax=Haemaphysalis longicornis TaxID=44386 RepID=A0A9J6FR67_HAELO|nr:hypothetical protein HPB48_015947 [Haemaphysalis longicornis]
MAKEQKSILSKPRPTKGRQPTTLTGYPPSKKPKKTYGELPNPRSSPNRRFLTDSTSQNARSSQPTVVHLRTYERKQTVVETCEEEVTPCDTVDTVTPCWSRIHTLETVRVVYVTSVIKTTGDRIEISHPKCVSFSTVEGPDVVAEAFFDGVLCCRAIISSLKEAEAIVQDAHTTHTCKGTMSAPEFAEVGSEQFVEVREQEGLRVEESPEQIVAQEIEVPPDPQRACKPKKVSKRVQNKKNALQTLQNANSHQKASKKRVWNKKNALLTRKRVNSRRSACKPKKGSKRVQNKKNTLKRANSPEKARS